MRNVTWLGSGWVLIPILATATVVLPRRTLPGPTTSTAPPEVHDAAQRMLDRHHELSDR